FWVVDAVVNAIEAGGYDGPVQFDYQPPRTENDGGAWVSAGACKRTYLILRDKVLKCRADPEVQAALDASKVTELSQPTLSEGETWRDVREVNIDIDAYAERGLGYELLDQLALEHLYGVR